MAKLMAKVDSIGGVMGAAVRTPPPADSMHGHGGQSDVHATAIQRLNDACDAWRENHLNGAESLDFLAGKQWPAAVLARRQAANLPSLTINLLHGLNNSVIQTIKNHMPSIAIGASFGEDLNASNLPHGKRRQKKAELLSGVVRHILRRSNAYDDCFYAVSDASESGMGFFRLGVDWEDVDPEDPAFFTPDPSAAERFSRMKFTIDHIPDRFSVLFDPAARNVDLSDANWVFILNRMSSKAFEKVFPGKNVDGGSTTIPSSVGRGQSITPSEAGADGTVVEVWEYFYKEQVASWLSFNPETGLAETSKSKPKGRAASKRYRNVVKRILMTQSEVLEAPEDWLGSCLPIFPVLGRRMVTATSVRFEGLTRIAHDAQQGINLSRSSAVSRIGRASHAPIAIGKSQIQNFTAEWEKLNNPNTAFVTYDDRHTASAPKRLDSNANIGPEERHSVDSLMDMGATTGIPQAKTGNKSNEVSGKALDARAAQSDHATRFLTDNLGLAMKRLVFAILEMLPKVYSQDDLLGIAPEDPQDEDSQIAAAEILERFLPSDYEVNIKAEGLDNDLHAEAFREAIITLIGQAPEFASVSADLLIETFGAIPGKGPLKKRIRRLIATKAPWAMVERERNEVLAEIGELPPDPEAAVRKAEADASAAASRSKEVVASNDAQKSAIELAGKEIDYQGKVLDGKQKAKEVKEKSDTPAKKPAKKPRKKPATK